MYIITVFTYCANFLCQIHNDIFGNFPFILFTAIEEVEATSSYYEKMSEELEKIVNEVKNSPIEENKTFADSVQPTALASEYCIVQLCCV